MMTFASAEHMTPKTFASRLTKQARLRGNFQNNGDKLIFSPDDWEKLA
jgi:hypothetical protein